MAEEPVGNDSEAKLLQRLAERYYEAYRRERGSDSAPTVEASLMRMMAVMGELSALAFTTSTGMSPFEKDEVSVLVGKLSISVAMIAEAFHLNVTRSTLQYLEEELGGGGAAPHRGPGPAPRPATKDAAAESRATATAPSPAAAARPGSTAAAAPHHVRAAPPSPSVLAPATAAAAQAPSVVLSPTSNDAFFRHVDQLATLPPEAFEKAGLKWVAPLPNGTIEELVPNGSAVGVRYEDFPQYLAHTARYREARASRTQPSPLPAQPADWVLRGGYRDPTAAAARNANGGGSAPHAAAGIPALLAQAPGYDPERESALYSPNHFSGDLFSPMARAADMQTMSVAPPAVMAAGENGGGERRGRAAVQQIGRPYDAGSFHDKVAMLRRGVVPRAAIAQLGLTFSVPEGQSVVELVNDGIHVDVTAANVGEFLRLLDSYPTAPPSSGRVHRTNSVRKIDVGRTIPDVPATFSPSHFSHDLFAPFQEPTAAVYVDYDKSDRMLPRYLKEHHVGATDTQELYVSAARSSDLTTLERIVQEAKADASALTRYGVTFSVPSSLEPYSTAEERRSGLHALFPSSALQRVHPREQLQFLSMARQYYPNVL
ncbi:hypothetical protein NESM_000721700 [Novymonas esmeraldas]|uniref:Uncharacterized protein n=1 Tax=Novymonas esmeraldas TaxID=1808958 RepID=A0AAW0EU53_9TRYP